MSALTILAKIGLAVFDSFEGKMSQMARNRNLPTESREQFLQSAMDIHDTKENIRRYASQLSMSEDMDIGMDMDEDEGVDEVMRTYEALYERLLRDSSNCSDSI